MTIRGCLVCVGFVAYGLQLSGGAATIAQTPPYPGLVWEGDGRVASAQEQARAEALRTTLRGGDTTGMLVVVGGRTRFVYGDLAQVSYIASVRKSVVAMLYGMYVDTDVIRLNRTLRDIGIDDKGPLLPVEREATVGDLLAA